MPEQSEHEDKARSIERALQNLHESNPDHCDWLTTLAFYAALHWVDAYFADHRLHPSNHRERNRAAQGLPIWDDYYELYALSRIARYEAGHVPQIVAARMRDQNLPAVRKWTLQSRHP